MLSDARMSGTGWGGFGVSGHDRTSDAWLPLVGSDALPKPWDSAVGRMQFGTGCTDAFGCFRMHGCRVLVGVGSAFHDMIAPRMHGCHWLARMRCQNPGTLRFGGCNLAPDARMLSDAFGCTDVGYWLGWVRRFMT